MVFAFGLNESLLFIVSIHNGWNTGDLHFLLFDIFHEQPMDLNSGVAGIAMGVIGFKIQIGIKYEK